MTRPVIYLSGPLTNGETLDPSIVEGNVQLAANMFKTLEALGFAAWVPHLTWELQQKYHVYLPHDRWIELDYALIKRSDALYRLPGESKGADLETSFAAEHDVPIFYSVDAMVNHFAGRVA